jgi:hypothetical protein
MLRDYDIPAQPFPQERANLGFRDPNETIWNNAIIRGAMIIHDLLSDLTFRSDQTYLH